MKARELLWNLQRQVQALKQGDKEINKESISNIIIQLEKQVSIDEELYGLEFEYDVDKAIYIDSKGMIGDMKQW